MIEPVLPKGFKDSGHTPAPEVVACHERTGESELAGQFWAVDRVHQGGGVVLVVEKATTRHSRVSAAVMVHLRHEG